MWSPETHARWPPCFKGAAATLLLAAQRSSNTSGATGTQLGVLPADLLLRVLSAAAYPLSAWV